MNMNNTKFHSFTPLRMNVRTLKLDNFKGSYFKHTLFSFCCCVYQKERERKLGIYKDKYHIIINGDFVAEFGVLGYLVEANQKKGSFFLRI